MFNLRLITNFSKAEDKISDYISMKADDTGKLHPGHLI